MLVLAESPQLASSAQADAVALGGYARPVTPEEAFGTIFDELCGWRPPARFG